MKNNKINENVISKIIEESIQYCSSAIGHPSVIDEKYLIKNDEIERNTNAYNNDVVDEEFSSILKEIANEFELSILLFDNKCNLLKILACSKNIKFIASNCSEGVLGTNSVCLAIKHGMPIQVLGKEHYNELLHQYNCSAAPIYDINKNIIIGVVNIRGIITHKHTMETLGLAQSIAKIIENRIQLKKILTQLTASNYTLKNVIENDNSGIIYLIDDEIINYNKSLLNMFEINVTGNDMERNVITDILDQVEENLHSDEIEGKELVLNINNVNKSFVVSMKQFIISENNEVCRFYKFENTNKYLRVNINNKAIYSFDDILGNNETFLEVKELAKKAARTNSAILIYGESGTGKELFAQSIHNESFRKNKPFVAINCGAIPTELIESELFGYEPGAFTGASNKIKFGKLEIASGGTFFFDEIESMPLNVQIKLLRALSSKKITRVGGIKEIPIDIRIISATKKDLLDEVERGQFREDLYFRINIISLSIPPLRDRVDDIPLLAKSFINYIQKQSALQELIVEPEFFEALKYYYWRGNVRELRNVIEKVVLLNDKKTLTLESLPQEIISEYKYESLKNNVFMQISEVNRSKNILKTGEEIIIEYVLNEENWNLTNTAKRLGISRPTLYRKIEDSCRLSKRKKILQQEIS